MNRRFVLVLGLVSGLLSPCGAQPGRGGAAGSAAQRPARPEPDSVKIEGVAVRQEEFEPFELRLHRRKRLARNVAAGGRGPSDPGQGHSGALRLGGQVYTVNGVRLAFAPAAGAAAGTTAVAPGEPGRPQAISLQGTVQLRGQRGRGRLAAPASRRTTAQQLGRLEGRIGPKALSRLSGLPQTVPFFDGVLRLPDQSVWRVVGRFTRASIIVPQPSGRASAARAAPHLRPDGLSSALDTRSRARGP